MLKRRAHQLALAADSFGDLFANLVAFREWEIEKPEEFSDAWLENLALWFWHKREIGQLWSGANSVIQIHRAALDELARRGEGLAFLLYGLLVSAHGHDPDARFAIVPDALKSSRRLKAGRNQIYAAIDLLIEVGLCRCVARPIGNRNHYLYQLGDARYAGGRGREEFKITLVPEKDTHRRPDDQELAA